MNTEHSFKSEDRIALFIDIENLIGEASRIGLPIDVSEVINKLREYGSIHVRRCYGDISRCLDGVGKRYETDNIRRMLYRNLVRIEDVPFLTQNKNTVDMRLVIDALSLAYVDPSIRHFAVLSSDRDYVPLFNKLHELGRTVIAVGIDPEATHSIFREAADHLHYYRNFFATAATVETKKEEEADVRPRYFDALCRAVTGIENLGRKPTIPAVRQRIGQLVPDFDLGMAGYSSFGELISDAVHNRLVRLESGEEPLLQLGESGRAALELPPQGGDAPPKEDDKTLQKRYVKILEEKLRIPLPALEHRRRILKAASRTYDELMSVGSFDMLEWKEATWNEVGNDIPNTEKAVYKTLISLFIARCFHCDVGEDWYNPRIYSLAQSSDSWEFCMHRLFTSNIVQGVGRRGISRTALCQTLFEDQSDENLAETDRLIQDVLES